MKSIITALLMVGTVCQVSICDADLTWRTYKSAYVGSSALGYNYVSTIAIDHNNVKYFGHYCLQARYDGIDFVSVYDPRVKYGKWSKIYTDFYTAESMAVDHNNIVWINDHRSWGREAGTYIWGYDGNDGTLFTSEILTGGGLGGHSRAIAVDKNNIKWIGFEGDFHYNGGIVKYDDSSGKVERHILYSIKHIAVDNKNNLWVAFYGGLFYYNGSEFIIHDYTNGFPGTNPGAIAVDHNNILWAGIWVDNDSLGGIASFDGSIWTLYDEKNSDLATDNVYSITVDHNNTKWIGTDAGVCRFDGETWTTFNTKNSGLCENKVNAIAVEKNNTIWFGTDNGVSQYTGEVITTGVDEEDKIPEAQPIIKSYPNPFNPSTTIEFTLPEAGFTTLTIYNISGQKIRELAAQYMTAGMHSLTWNGRDGNGDAVSSGIYIIRLQAGKAGCGRQDDTYEVRMVNGEKNVKFKV